MRSLLIIVLINVHLFGNTELGQLIKLPQLITHYKKNHKNNPSLNFFQFLVMHYAGDDGTTADDNEDRQLPCHDYHHSGKSMCSLYFGKYAKIAASLFNCSGKNNNYQLGKCWSSFFELEG